MQQTRLAWQPYHTVWLVMVFAWITAYMVRIALSPALVQIRHEFNLSFTEAGFLATAFFYAYTFMQVPAGILGDRIGRRVIILASAIGWTVTAFLTALVTSVGALFAVRLGMGVAEGALFSNDRPVIAAVTPPARMGMGQGLSFAGLGIGLALGLLLGGVLIDAVGWRATFVIFGLLSLIAVMAAWRYVPEPLQAIHTPDGNPRPARLSQILRQADLWFLAVAGVGAVYAQWVVGTWAPTVLTEVGGQTLSAASAYSAAFGLAALPGLFGMGILSDGLVRRGYGRKVVGALCLLGVTLSMALLGLMIEVRAPAAAMGAGIFLTGLFIWGFWSPLFALYSEIMPASVRGTIFGLVNAVAFIGSLVAPGLSGLIRDATHSFAGGFYLAAGLALLAVPTLLAAAPAFRLGPEPPLQLPSPDEVCKMTKSNAEV